MTRLAGLPVLTFHSFGESKAVHSADPSWFDETLAMLAEAGFHCVDLDDWVASGRPDEPLGYAITIDDGLRSILKIVDSLQKHRATATVFLATGRVGSNNAWPGQPSWVPVEPILFWNEIRSLAKVGLKFAAHGVTHARLDRCSASRIEAELKGSRDAIEDCLGTSCRLVAYPYGSANRFVKEFARKAFLGGFGTRLDFADGDQDPLELARVDTFYLRTDRLRAAVGSGHGRPALRWRSALRGAKQTALTALRPSRPY